MKQGDELLLQLAAHIDQQVAATDQIEFGERRILDHVLLGKDQQIADDLVDAIGAVRILAEKARQPLGRDIGGDAGGKDAAAGLFDGLLSMSVAKTCTLKVLSQRLQMLLEQDGDGIGLLAGGTAGHPDPNRPACGLVGKKARDDLCLEGFEGLRVAEEAGDADQQVTKEGIYLRRVSLQVAKILVRPLDLVDGHAPLDAAGEGGLLCIGRNRDRSGHAAR